MKSSFSSIKHAKELQPLDYQGFPAKKIGHTNYSWQDIDAERLSRALWCEKLAEQLIPDDDMDGCETFFNAIKCVHDELLLQALKDKNGE